MFSCFRAFDVFCLFVCFLFVIVVLVECWQWIYFDVNCILYYNYFTKLLRNYNSFFIKHYFTYIYIKVYKQRDFKWHFNSDCFPILTRDILVWKFLLFFMFIILLFQLWNVHTFFLKLEQTRRRLRKKNWKFFWIF